MRSQKTQDILKSSNEIRSPQKSIYSHRISARIKDNIKQEWNRQKHLHGKTQEELATFLNVSQGAVSKLLNDRSKHPWSIDKIEAFAMFCNVSIIQLIEDTDLIGHFNNWHHESPSQDTRRTMEAKAALQRFASENDSSLDDEKLNRLAERLVVRIEETDRSPNSYNKEILKLLISEV